MLASKNRLTKRRDFVKVYSTGAYAAIGGIAIKYLETKSPETRIGFSIGKTFSKKATERNLARRILRESVREQLSFLKTGFDIIIIAQGKERELIFDQTSKTVRQIFAKTNLLR